MTRLLLLLVGALAGVAAIVATPAGSGGAYPGVIALPNGFQPEGIATWGTRFYVGSIPTGAVYRGDLRTGKGSVLVAGGAGRAAIGLEVDRGRIFVAGGPTGKAFVYNARTGAEIAALTLTTGATFVNDVVVTRNAAWFTDSFNAVLYRVALGPGGRVGPSSAVRTLPLTGDIAFAAGFNTNGIDATPNGKTLVIVQSNTGKLFRVTLAGVTDEIELAGGDVQFGDGILLDGPRLWVVQNQLNRVARVQLRPGLRSGRIVGALTDPDLDVPTTIDQHGARLYAVNARFGTPPTPSTPYQVVQLRKR